MTARAPRPAIVVSLANVVGRLVPSMSQLAPVATAAEHWGADAVTIGDHVVWTADMHHPTGAVLDPALSVSLPDPIALLGVIAGCTVRIRLMTGALIAGLRHPLLLARQAASVAALSAGRFDLGLTAGWNRDEFAVLGVDFDQRFARLDDALGVCQALWREDVAVSFHGRFVEFDGVLPRPFPAEPIPVWIGGQAGERTAARVARAATGWIASVGASLDDVERARRAIAAACSASGREPSSIDVMVQLVAGSDLRLTPLAERFAFLLDAARQATAAGATHVVVPLADLAGDLGEARELVARLVDALF